MPTRSRRPGSCSMAGPTRNPRCRANRSGAPDVSSWTSTAIAWCRRVTSRRLRLAPADADDLNRLGDALQGQFAWLGEREVARLGGVPAGEHLPALRLGGDARRLMDALAAVIESDTSGGRLVYADPNLGREAVRTAMIGQRALDLQGALDGALGLREAGKHAIPTVADLFPGMPRDQAAQRLVVPVQHLVPGVIS